MSALKKVRSAQSYDADEIPRSAALLDALLDEIAEFCDPMNLSERDGFLAGIAVCPESVGVEEWLPATLNLERDAKIDAVLAPDTAASLMGLLVADLQRISVELARGAYLPIADRHAQVAEEFWHPWICGFSKAMALRPGSWDRFALGDGLTRNALKGLRNLIALRQGEADLPPGDDSALKTLAPMLIPLWVGILMSWNLSAGSNDFFEAEPQALGQLPGRNDPCSCGSGKKYKKCCYLA